MDLSHTVRLYVEAPDLQEMSIRQLGRSIARDWPDSFVRLHTNGRVSNAGLTGADHVEHLLAAADLTEPGYVGKHRRVVSHSH